MPLYLLEKTVLSIRPEPEKFLTGLTSNTLDQPRNAFLNVNGRIISTFDQLKVSDEEFYIVVASSVVEVLMDHLDKFIRLSRAVVHALPLRVYYDLAGEYRLAEGEFLIPQKKGNFILTPKELKSDVSDEAFVLFRLENDIPLQGIDYHNELILNVHEDDFVSFTKGCFLGQEPVAKVHNRSQPTWRLSVCFEDECDEGLRAKMTSKAKDPVTGRVKGFVFVRR